MTKKEVFSPEAPAKIGPYSQAVDLGDFVYLSGQTGTDPATGNLVEGGIAAQTRQTILNLTTVLKAADLTLSNVVKTLVFITDMGEFANMNAVYEKYFTDCPPARSCVQVAALPKGALVEIELIARR